MRLARETIGIVAAILILTALPCTAQSPGPLPPNQTLGPGSAVMAPQVGSSGIAVSPAISPALPSTALSSSITSAVVSAPTVGTSTPSGKLSPSVGRRLPGMGGAPLNSPMGAGNMVTPAIIEPLSCDLIADPACM